MRNFPLSAALASLSAALAISGLAALALLTVPHLPTVWRDGLEGWLLVVWCCFLLRLVLNLWTHGVRGVPRGALVGDLLMVLVPLAGVLGLFGPPEPPLYVGIWLLVPLRQMTAFQLVWRVIGNEQRNLLGVLTIFLIILFSAAFLQYLFERHIQPETFGSIPHAMWWAVVTLTTTGYGDAVPLTPMGRMLAGFVMLCGIGVFALWAGILANGFSEEIRRNDFASVWQVAAQIPLFAGVNHADLAEIVRALKPRRVPQGTVICRKGEAGTEMFFILEGRVRVDSQAPVMLGPGEYFGEMALVTGERRGASVSAETPASLLSLHISDFQRIFGQNSSVAEHIRQTAKARMHSNVAPVKAQP
jgi:voltage-gated potassium channel